MRRSDEYFKECLVGVLNQLSFPYLNKFTLEDLAFFCGSFVFEKDTKSRLATFKNLNMSKAKAQNFIRSIIEVRTKYSSTKKDFFFN